MLNLDAPRVFCLVFSVKIVSLRRQLAVSKHLSAYMAVLQKYHATTSPICPPFCFPFWLQTPLLEITQKAENGSNLRHHDPPEVFQLLLRTQSVKQVFFGLLAPPKAVTSSSYKHLLSTTSLKRSLCLVDTWACCVFVNALHNKC